MNETRDDFDIQKELSNCTFVKTSLMFLVVFYHSIIFWTGTWFGGEPFYNSFILSTLSRWLNSFHIYGFALVSGYLFYFLKCEKGKYSSFIPFGVNKVKRLLLPYVFVSVIWVIPFALHYFDYSLLEVIKKYALGISPSQLWFLLMLFFVFMLFYPLTSFFEKHNVSGAIVALAIYGVGMVGSMVLPNVFQILTACQYLPLLWLGFKIRQYGSKNLMKIPSPVWIAVDVLLFILVQYLSGFDATIIKLINLGLTFLLHIIGALMAFVVLQKLANRVNWKESKVFSVLSKNSMPVYLFHQQVIYVFISLLNGVINPYLHAGINFIGAMAISLLISTLLMKFKWTRFLIGEK